MSGQLEDQQNSISPAINISNHVSLLLKYLTQGDFESLTQGLARQALDSNDTTTALDEQFS